MKHVFCVAIVLLLCVGCSQKDNGLQAADASAVVLKGHTSGVTSASFSPDGKKVVTAGNDKTIRIWNAESGKELQKWVVASSYYRLFGGIHEALASNIVTGEVVKPTTDGVGFARFFPDGTKIVTVNRDNTIRIRDAESGKELQKLESQTQGTWYVDFSPDGKRMISSGNDGTAQIIEVGSGKVLHVLRGHIGNGPYMPARVIFVAFSPDGKKIVTTGIDETARIWDADSGKELLTLDLGKELQQREVGQIVAVNSATFSPDGKKVATAAQHGVTAIWDAESGEIVQKLDVQKETVNSIAFSPDGTKIVTVSGYEWIIRIWDAESGKVLQKLEGHTSMVYSAYFSPDGKRIVTASWDDTARIWFLEP